MLRFDKFNNFSRYGFGACIRQVRSLCALVVPFGLSWMLVGVAWSQNLGDLSAGGSASTEQGRMERPYPGAMPGGNGAFPSGMGAVGTGRAVMLPPGSAAIGSGQVGSGSQLQPGQAMAVQAPLPPLATTQYQRFVQESTGKLLPLYGYALFERSRYPSVVDAPVPANYVVGPGDELDIKIWGAVDVALRLPVDRQGQITVPKVGPVTVAGIKAGELDDHLKKQVSRVFANFELSASVGKLRTVQVFVVGQARSPGAYILSSLSTLVSAVFESGGPSATGSMRKIELVRSGAKVAVLDLYKFIQGGDTSADTRLMPGDVIVVPPAGPRVAVTGAIDNQFVFELAGQEESLSQLLAYSGSSITLASPHKVLVERVDNQKIKGPREVLERALDEQGLKTTVRDGDVLTLLKISGEFANAVTLRGNVVRPLRYAFKPGMRISDLIPEADALITDDYYQRRNIVVQFDNQRMPGLDQRNADQRFNDAQWSADSQPGVQLSARDKLFEGLRVEAANRAVSADLLANDLRTRLSEINWDYASVERLDRQHIKVMLIPFDLGRAIKDRDPEQNLELLPGDVVTVYSVNDIAVPRDRRAAYVKLVGEVRKPGLYSLKSGETLTDLIQRAGGMTQAAYVFGTVLTRQSTRVKQQENLDKAIRLAESTMGSRLAATAQNLGDAQMANPLAQQALQAQQIAYIEKLRSQRATGRVSLDLDADRPEIPQIALEDGDEVMVPSTPTFISVFGAVLTENTFIYRSGLTVSDYIQKAGAIREADLESAVLIRADGTLSSSKAQRSLFGFGNYSFMGQSVQPGDTIFVPEVLDKRTPYMQFIQGAKDWSQLLYQFGLSAVAIKTLRN